MSLKNIQFVDADRLATIEDYAAALVSGMITLQTLARFHTSAESKGLLKDDEHETCKTLLWELKRLYNLYKTQAESILERTEITQDAILDSLRGMVPQVKKKSEKVPKNAEKEGG